MLRYSSPTFLLHKILNVVRFETVAKQTPQYIIKITRVESSRHFERGAMICRGGSRNFRKGGGGGGLYTIVVTFNTNGVEGELRPRASGTSS